MRGFRTRSESLDAGFSRWCWLGDLHAGPLPHLPPKHPKKQVLLVLVLPAEEASLPRGMWLVLGPTRSGPCWDSP